MSDYSVEVISVSQCILNPNRIYIRTAPNRDLYLKEYSSNRSADVIYKNANKKLQSGPIGISAHKLFTEWEKIDET